MKLEDDEGSLDQFRQRRGAKQIPHLIVEDATSLPRVFEEASETLSRARLDRIHFFVPEGGSIPNPADELSAYGYVLLASRGGKLEHAQCAAPLTSGCYVAVHERLTALVLGQQVSTLDLPKLCREHGVDVRGVLHVGAHEGGELGVYELMGAQRVVLVEANPAVYARLAEAMRGRPDVMAIHRAISDKAGRVKLHLASSDRCGSLLPMASHLVIYPDIAPLGTVEVDATTLDALLGELALPVSQFNLLRVGVQGAEARVLSGAKDVLPHMDAVAIEVSFAELYQRCSQVEDIDRILGSAGFQRVSMASPVHPSWAEAFYVRDSSSNGNT